MIKGSQKPKQEGLILSWRLQLGPVCLLAFRVLYCTHPSAPLLLTPQHLSCSSAKLPLWRCQDVFSTRLGVWTQISYYYFQLSHSYALRSAVWNAKCSCKPKKKSPKCGENSADELFQYNYPHLCTIWSLESMLHLFHLPEFSCLPWQESCFKSYWFSMTWCLINKPRVWISTVSISVTLILIHL